MASPEIFILYNIDKCMQPTACLPLPIIYSTHTHLCVCVCIQMHAYILHKTLKCTLIMIRCVCQCFHLSGRQLLLESEIWAPAEDRKLYSDLQSAWQISFSPSSFFQDIYTNNICGSEWCNVCNRLQKHYPCEVSLLNETNIFVGLLF